MNRIYFTFIKEVLRTLTPDPKCPVRWFFGPRLYSLSWHSDIKKGQDNTYFSVQLGRKLNGFYFQTRHAEVKRLKRRLTYLS